MINRQIRLKSLPVGELREDNFEMVEEAAPLPGKGELLIRNLLISQDAANRAWMRGPSYRQAVRAGDVMHAYTIGEVVESSDPAFAIGTRVFGEGGWQDLYTAAPASLRKVRGDVPLPHLLNLVGIAGRTAYHGLISVGQLRQNDVLVVTAAAGSVGLLAGQIGKAMGCKVIGIAGGARKCHWLVEGMKFDAAVDYKTESFLTDIRSVCGEGVDVLFDNVGGDVCGAVLPLMKLRGRIVCCGAISQYDGSAPASPAGLPGILIAKRLRMEGFIVFDFEERAAEAEDALLAWFAQGRIKVVEEVLEGLAAAPKGLIGLLGGENVGKRMVRV